MSQTPVTDNEISQEEIPENPPGLLPELPTSSDDEVDLTTDSAGESKSDSDGESVTTNEAVTIAEEKEETAATEEKEETVTEEKEEAEELKCIVCYEKLHLGNIVNTQCDHKYCWECFFKWIKNSPSCPYCRCNFISEEAWYENRDIEQDASNMRHLVDMLQMDMVRHSRDIYVMQREKDKLCARVNSLKKERKDNLRSCISLNEQIEYMRGYHSALRGDQYEPGIVKRSRHTPWFKGFTCGVFDMIQERNNIDYDKLNCYVRKRCVREDTFYPSEKWNNKDAIPYKKTRDRGVCTEMTFSFTPEEPDVVDLTKESNLTETNETISESKNAERVGPAVSV